MSTTTVTRTIISRHFRFQNQVLLSLSLVAVTVIVAVVFVYPPEQTAGAAAYGSRTSRRSGAASYEEQQKQAQRVALEKQQEQQRERIVKQQEQQRERVVKQYAQQEQQLYRSYTPHRYMYSMQVYVGVGDISDAATHFWDVDRTTRRPTFANAEGTRFCEGRDCSRAAAAAAFIDDTISWYVILQELEVMVSHTTSKVHFLTKTHLDQDDTAAAAAAAATESDAAAVVELATSSSSSSSTGQDESQSPSSSCTESDKYTSMVVDETRGIAPVLKTLLQLDSLQDYRWFHQVRPGTNGRWASYPKCSLEGVTVGSKLLLLEQVKTVTVQHQQDHGTQSARRRDSDAEAEAEIAEAPGPGAGRSDSESDHSPNLKSQHTDL
jgi:hypothetical protein